MKKMTEIIKEQGSINLEELSKKQLLALVSIWSWNFIKKENTSFSDMVKKCYKSKPWHENATILYVHGDSVIDVEHAFHDMYDSEECLIMDLLSR